MSDVLLADDVFSQLCAGQAARAIMHDLRISASEYAATMACLEERGWIVFDDANARWHSTGRHRVPQATPQTLEAADAD